MPSMHSKVLVCTLVIGRQSGIVITHSSAPPQAVPSSSTDVHPSTQDEAAPETPRRVLSKAILKVLSPPPSTDTEEAKAQKKMKRKRVQSTMGEVLTNEAVLERLQKESTWRKEKEKK